MKKISLILLLIPLLFIGNGVEGKNIFQSSNSVVNDTLAQYGHNKIIPKEFELPILTALSHFPELRNLHIEFQIHPAYTPLATRPANNSLLKRKNRRTYIVNISNKTIDTLKHLLYANLSFTEQVGIIGHELSHVVDFDSKNIFQSCGNAIGHLSNRFLDKMEYHTDLICIRHGLGSYLKAYSLHVRQSMHVTFWRGVDHVFQKNLHFERYMNPSTIEKYMRETH